MDFNPDILSKSEKMIYALRSLYSAHGYSRFKMSKFEEYDLYSRNKDFLVSDAVITFTDTNGKLLALKPDVTLSIIKNSRENPDGIQKVCYNENVYRVSKGTNSFKEIMQTGVECMGQLTPEDIGQVLMLASESLDKTGANNVLLVSHLGILSSFTDIIPADDESKETILQCVSEKNVHGIKTICSSLGIEEEKYMPLVTLSGLYGPAGKILPELCSLCETIGAKGEAEELSSALAAAGKETCEKLIIDFSVVGNMNYYNGIVFNGFVEGVPGSVLSGGQYDRLMKKLGKKSKAIGFAVYIDMLERTGDD